MNLFGGTGELVDSIFAIIMIIALCIVLYRLVRSFYRFGMLIFWAMKLDEENFVRKREELEKKWTKRKSSKNK